MTIEQAVIAANRFGLGARPGDLDVISSDPQAWLEDQISQRIATPGALSQLPSSRKLLGQMMGLRRDTGDPARENGRRRGRRARRRDRQADTAPDAPLSAEDRQKMIREKTRDAYLAEVGARTREAAQSLKPFQERLVHFWSNHFTVSITNPKTASIAGAFERETVRRHVMGKFSDMLLSVITHPAMLIYLNNEISVGPNSKAGRRRDCGLNENLAREILELHTLGVDGGYTQDDVTNFAKVLTGWTVANGDFFPGPPGTFTFVEQIHEPGEHRILGKTYSQEGVRQGLAVLSDLASHPATARHIAYKLARHFIADEPPSRAVDRLAHVYAITDGDLAALSRELILLPEAWGREPAKLKSPNDFVISSLRALGLTDLEDKMLAGFLDMLGQRPFYAPSPAGWPDTAEEWAGGDALIKRIEWSAAVSERIGNYRDPIDIAGATLGPTLSKQTSQTIARAESRRQGLALLLGSPDFQWR